MEERFSRTERLVGTSAMAGLENARVMVVGLGGVGGHAAEALVRVGVGHLILVDGDSVALSNCNRQILADDSTLGMRKTQAAKKRFEAINPAVQLTLEDTFLTRESAEALISRHKPRLVLDCIDTMSAKVGLALGAKALDIPILTCASTGNKWEPDRLRVSPLSKTHTCPICRILRHELKEAYPHLPVLWSDEPPMTPQEGDGGERTPASAPFVPPVAGILMAQWATSRILKGEA